LAATVAAFWTGGKPLTPFKTAVIGPATGFETVVSSCRPFKRRFKASFEKVSNDYLFSENRRKILKKFVSRLGEKVKLYKF
jgi:coproporphyrinogen III oxidase